MERKVTKSNFEAYLILSSAATFLFIGALGHLLAHWYTSPLNNYSICAPAQVVTKHLHMSAHCFALHHWQALHCYALLVSTVNAWLHSHNTAAHAVHSTGMTLMYVP